MKRYLAPLSDIVVSLCFAALFAGIVRYVIDGDWKTALVGGCFGVMMLINRVLLCQIKRLKRLVSFREPEPKVERYWCPSEEQMNLLAKAAEEGDGEQRKDLMVLYNELKKFVVKK